MNQMSLFFPTDQSATVQMILSRNELCARHSLHLTNWWRSAPDPWTKSSRNLPRPRMRIGEISRRSWKP